VIASSASLVLDSRCSAIALTVPVLGLSPFVQDLLGLRRIIAFSGDSYVLFALSAVVFFYGGSSAKFRAADPE
jgi:hypothetical protein